MHRVHHGRRNPNQPPHKKIMSVPIRIRRRQTGSAGAPGVLKSAELAFNEVDGILYYGKGVDASGNATQIVGIGGNASSSYADGLIATEQTARIAADSDLASDIAAEETRALAAESALGTRIDNVLSNVTAGSLDSLSEVVAAFEAADSSLNGAITSLANSASTNLTNEVNRATAAEVALQGRATSLESRATSVEGRMTTAEADILAEVSNRGTAVSSEASTRLSADNALSARILVLETEIDGGSF